MKELYNKLTHKIKNKWFIIFTAMFIFAVFLVVVPHYDKDGKNVLIGKYYTERSAKLDKKVKELENWETNNVTHLTSRIVSLQKNNKEIEEDNEKLKEQIKVLTDKLTQQEDFYKTKDKVEIEEKKVRFSNVSKKEIRNDRPEFGNSFSKAIKKSKIDL
tara:strand:- start:58 stop:534 length:477 start_codon:yes stop_codon:yes gene_type:complete